MDINLELPISKTAGTNNEDASLSEAALQKEMLRLANGYTISQCIFTAAELGIVDLLKDGAKHCDELAEKTDTQSKSLYRLLVILDDIGILSESKPRQFQLAPLGNCLLSDSTSSLRNLILLNADHYYNCWADLTFTLRTGTSAFVHKYGMEPYPYIKQKPALAKIFDLAMSELSRSHDEAIAAAYNFSTVKTIVDVGGGQGAMVEVLLNRYPHLEAVLFEQPHVIKMAESFFEKKSFSDRCTFVSGDFFKAIPTGADVYLFRNVLNDWAPEQVIKILENCRQAMTEKSRLLVAQRVSTADDPLSTKVLNVTKLLMRSSTSSVRTKEEWNQLYLAAGFNLNRVISTETDYTIIEGALL